MPVTDKRSFPVRRDPDWDPGEHDAVPDRMQQMRQMRAQCPVSYTARATGYWTLLKYADIKRAALDTQIFGNGGAPRHGVPLPPLEVDPPLHREYRLLLNPFFMPKRVQALEPRVRRIADNLIAPLVARGTADLAKELSYPLPVLTLCALLDLREDAWADVKRLSEESLLVESHQPEERVRARAAHLGLMEYARELVADRLAHPRASTEDITSALLAAYVGGSPIGPDTAAGMLRLLISAGHNSTTSGFGNALLYLARHPDAQQHLRENPDEIPTAVEELLRYETPVQGMPRYLHKDITLNGRELLAGERVDLMYGSANRDEEVFEQADQCLIHRKPNRHVAFGHGIHTCIGAPIARMEMRVGLECLLAQCSSFRVAGEVVRAAYHRVGVESLPAILDR